MSIPKSDGRFSAAMASEILTSPSSRPLVRQDQQDEETSDCPLLTPSPPVQLAQSALDSASPFIARDDAATPLDQTLDNINSEDGLAFLNIVNSSCKRMHDEPSSRDPMVETSSNSGSSSDTNEPVCTQLLTQLNTAYTHLAPDAQALFYNQDNSGKPPLPIQLVVPKPPKDYSFTKWNWPVIRKTCFFTFMSLFVCCIALVVSVLYAMPKRCDPKVEWWQGSVFYEIEPSGIGDLRGITKRLDYLEKLGVKGVRLNSIFPSAKQARVDSLTDIEPSLGSLADFDEMVSAVHERKMALILDLPLYPFVKNLDGNADGPNSSSAGHPLDENEVSRAVRFWHARHVDGLYLKGLERYAYEINFAGALRHWKAILGPDKILMCSQKALDSESEPARAAVLGSVNLVDVTLAVSNGTKSIKSQVLRVLRGPLFQKPGYPWVHWSTGSKVANASVAIAMMDMMLPGTPSIFYGDEVAPSAAPSAHPAASSSPLAPQVGTLALPRPAGPLAANLSGLVPKMLRLRSETTPIYVKAVFKNNEPVANGDVRYTTDEMIVIERWYPRRNTYVFVANLGHVRKTKDLSSLYYGGYVVVGPEATLNRNIYFKELTIEAGEAFVIKLDK